MPPGRRSKPMGHTPPTMRHITSRFWVEKEARKHRENVSFFLAKPYGPGLKMHVVVYPWLWSCICGRVSVAVVMYLWSCICGCGRVSVAVVVYLWSCICGCGRVSVAVVVYISVSVVFAHIQCHVTHTDHSYISISNTHHLATSGGLFCRVFWRVSRLLLPLWGCAIGCDGSSQHK